MEDFDLFSRIETEAKHSGDFILVYGPGGVGKTTMFTRAPKTLVIQVVDKSLDTLTKHGIITALPKINANGWEDLLNILNQLVDKKHDYRAVLIDGASGAEEYCDGYTTESDCEGSRDKFLAFGRGEKLSANQWSDLLNVIDKLTEDKGMNVILLAHREIQTIQNPNGTNYTQFVPALSKHKLAPTNKYADAVLMMDFIVAVTKDEATGKGKAASANARVLYCDGNAGFYAKNRLKLPPVISLGNSHDEGWKAFVTALQAGKKPKETVTA